MEVIYIGISAFIGAIINALLGWTESSDAFDVRKFTSSIIRGVIGAAGIAAAFNYAEDINAISFIIAFLAGAGVDAGGNRIAGAIVSRLK